MIEKRRGRSAGAPSTHLAAEAQARIVALGAALLGSRTLLVMGHGPALVAAANSVVEAPMA